MQRAREGDDPYGIIEQAEFLGWGEPMTMLAFLAIDDGQFQPSWVAFDVLEQTKDGLKFDMYVEANGRPDWLHSPNDDEDLTW